MRHPRGRRGGFRGRDGGRGGGGRFGGHGGGFRAEGTPAEVIEVSSFVHACEGDAVTKLTNEKIPSFNAPIYLQNKTQVGKVDEIFGPINASTQDSDGKPLTTHEDRHDRTALEARMVKIEENHIALMQEIKENQAYLKRKLKRMSRTLKTILCYIQDKGAPPPSTESED